MLNRSVGAGLAGVLLYSSVSHLKNSFFFLGTVYSYELLSPSQGVVVAVLLPTMQFLLAAFIFAGLWNLAVAILTSFMFAVFSISQSIAFARGLLIPCGCFGLDDEMQVGWMSLAMVFGLLAFSLIYAKGCAQTGHSGTRSGG